MPTNIDICIQARASSTRMPGKSTKPLGDGTIISYMVKTIKNSILPLKGPNTAYDFQFSVNLLVPELEFDFWVERHKHNFDLIIGGDLNNVFSRFWSIYEMKKPKYLMRLTADCPLIPQPAINRSIYQAAKHRIDYMCNSWEHIRTTPDGHDVELMSADAMEWLNANNSDQEDFEHVTIALRKKLPSHLRMAILSTIEDNSHIKCSIDTPDDFNGVNYRLNRSIEKRKKAQEMGLGVYEY